MTNAIKFIKDHGVERAREVVDGAPSNAESYQDGYYFRTKPEFQFHNGFHPVWNLTDSDGEWFKKDGFDPVAIDDLKRLVESVDLLKSNGGYEEAKDTFDFAIKHGMNDLTEFGSRLKQAIADYEAIYSNTPKKGELETLDHPEDYTSPNCKKFDERVK